MLTKYEIDELRENACKATAAFSFACSRGSISREEFENIQSEYNEARRKLDAALGYK